MLSDDDNLGIYDDLDEFQQAEDHKSKELLAWEVKHRNALTEIEDLKSQNKALEKKIKIMEVNLQNLLDTAKSEVKRKEVLIGQLRKEKDDICFRRKRGREVGEPAEKEPENKRLKAATKVDPEVKKNPFKAGSKIEEKSVGKRRSRSKSPRSRSKIQDHGSERRISRERRRTSPSRSPRHLNRQEEHRSRGSSWRRRSRSPSPRAQVSGSKTQIIPSLLGKVETNDREIGRKPHHEKVKRNRDEIAAPLKSIELCTPKVENSKTQSPTIKCDDMSTADGFQGSTPFESNNPTTDTNRNTGALLVKEVRIPGLDMIDEPAAHNRESPAATSQSEVPEINHQNEILPQGSVTPDPKSAQKEEPQPALISDNSVQIDEHLLVDAIAIEPSKPAIESPMRNTKCEPTGTDGIDNGVEKSTLNHLTIELIKDHIMVQAEKNADLLVASGAAQSQGDINFSSAGSLSEPRSESCDEGIRIIEDIRLPEVSDIGHISHIVNDLCGGLEGVAKIPQSDEQNNLSGNDVDFSDARDFTEGLKEPTTPSMCSNVLYAQPDSTKIDQNDTENGVNLETTLSLLPCTDQAPPPHTAPNESYPNVSLEEDVIEKALGKLHQTLSPDETVVTSTSNRARKAEDNCAPTSTSLSHSPVQPEEPIIEATLPEMVNANESKSQVSRILELEPPSPRQDITIDETVDNGCIANEDPLTITKRCSLGHTDYQFEQRNDEIILRVKRRTRRRCSTPLEVQVPKAPSTGCKPD